LSNNELKRSIQNSIITFSQEPVYHAAVNLFNTLGYNTERKNPFPEKTYEFFKESFLGDDSLFSEEKAIIKDWESIDLLFQLTADEVSYQSSLFNTKQVNNTIIETYLFFSVGLSESEYTRTQLAQITREINKVFPMPVFILFKHGENITFSVINRRLNKKDTQKDVLEKVTVIKDISTSSPHRAHIEILFDLSFSELQRVHKFTNFVELHNAWQKTLDTKELNKRFYRDLSYWYFWALDEVSFPAANWSADKNSIQNEEEKVKGHNAKNLIRLLTRLLFVWFVKEKNLVPDELFDESYIKDKLLNGFEPRKKKDFDHKTQGSKYYRAILQNLFFATLNQTMGKREFRQEGRQMNVTNLMRYESYFKDPKTFIRLVEDVVPFMNGGLFECLDSPDPMLKGKEGGDVIIYEDGFSDRKDNTLCVPDYIFFGTAEHADLSAELGDKKQKDITVNGLINILKSYKFTVTENTPIEEDIALDPELLGRVFENLLASYNPETKTTARKQTGSFYTPREIVNYMVDESLKAYLKQKLEASQNSSPPFQGGVPRSGGVVNSPTTNLRSGGTVRINNLPHLKTFRKELRNNLTPAEAKLWTYLQNSQLEGRKFRRQHSVANYILDFYCPSEKLAIELDGEVHNNVEQAEYDRERDLFLLATGIKVLRFENRVVFENPQGLLDDVKNEYGWVNKTTRVFEHDGGIITTPAFGHPSLSGGELFEDKLSDLISYSENDPDFTDQQKTVLISAIDSCKILDPACGSGAFPMGILHKLVHILHKLDPNNKLWKERQIEKVNALIANAQDITDSNIREKIINDLEESKKDIETAFESNELDYGRKLFLIENCIYGVDIQPIAIQISKLRFFISLIVDQKSSPPAKGESAKREGVKENLGIRPLPNLETKFVAANTLIGIERPKVDDYSGNLLDNPKVHELEAKLKEIRHRLFSAKTPSTKRKLRDEDQRIREEMGNILEDAGWSNESARQLAAWDPYNQNVSSGWFDPEWMFGIGDGFDVVIGNPPYLESRHPSFSDSLKLEYQKHCSLRWGDDSNYITKGSDLLVYFFETSIKIISRNGTIVLITQNAWLDTEYGIKLQYFLTKNTNVKSIIDSKYRYFPAGEGPNINTVITIFNGKEPINENAIKFVLLKDNIQEIAIPQIKKQYYSDQSVKINSFDNNDPLLSKYKWGILHNSDYFILELLSVLEKRALPLYKMGNSTKYQYGQGLNLAKSFFIPKEIVNSLYIKSNAKIPLLYSGSPFQLDNSDWFLVEKNKTEKNTIKELKSLGYNAFDTNSTRKLPPVLIMPRGISKHFCCKNNISAYSLSGVDVYCNDSSINQNEVNRLWLFFNSSIFWLLREISGRKNLGGGLLKSEAADLKNFPVYIEFEIPNEILTLKREALNSSSEIKTTEHKIIDDIVFDSLKLTRSQQNNCQEYLIKMIELRSSKSTT